MSLRVEALVYDRGPRDPVEFGVLLYLSRECNDFGGNCFPSLERISMLSRYEKRTVQRALRKLEVDGLLSIQRGRGKGNFSRYKINVPELEKRIPVTAWVEDDTAEALEAKGCQPVTFSRRVDLDMERCQSVTLSQDQKDDSDGQERCQPVTFSPVENDPQKVTLTTPKGDFHSIPPHPLLGRLLKTSTKATTPLPPVAGGVVSNVSTSVEQKPESKSPRLARSQDASPTRTTATGIGVRAAVGVYAGMEAGIDQAMAGCGFSDNRLRAILRGQMQLEVDVGKAVPTAALEMVAAWKSQTEQAGLLAAKYGPRKFFSLGVWRNEGAWHWDQERLKDLRRSRFG